MTDQFGGVEVDEFGGVAVDDGAPDLSKIKLSPYEQAVIDRGGIKPESGMESGTELTAALGQAAHLPQIGEYIGGKVIAPTLEAINKPLTYAGNVARAIPADVAAGMFALRAGLPEAAKVSGNIPAAIMGKPMPIDEALKEASSESKAAAVTGKISQGVAAMIPTIVAFGGLPAVAQKVALAGFTAKQLVDFKDAYTQLGDELGKPEDQQDPDKITSLVSELTQTGAFAGLGVGGVKVMLKPNIKAFPSRIGMEAPAETGSALARTALPRPGELVPEQLRAGPLRWAGERLPIPTGVVASPTGIAPAPSTAQLPPPAQRDLSAQGQIDALMQQERGPAPSTAELPVDLNRSVTAPSTGRTPEGRGRPFDLNAPDTLSAPYIRGDALNMPLGSKPHPQQALLDEIIREGVKRSDAEALLAGTKSVKQVVNENLDIVTPSRDFSQLAENPNSSFGHADAMEEGYTMAISRLEKILGLDKHPVTWTKFPTAQEIFNSNDKDLQTTKRLYGEKEVVELARSMTEEQLKQAEPFILEHLQSKKNKVEKLKKQLSEGKLTPEEFIQQQLDAEFVYGKGKIFTDVFSALNRPLSKPPTPPPPAPVETTVATSNLPPPASSVGLSAPVDISQPPKPKKAYSGARYQADADEFRRLVLEHGLNPEFGWIKNPDLVTQKTGTYTDISSNAQLKKAYALVLDKLGIKADRITEQVKANALPALKTYLAEHAKLVEVPLDNLGPGSKFTHHGETYTVGDADANTGMVKIRDGVRMDAPMEGSIKADPGSVVAKPLGEIEFGEAEGPKLGQGAKQGDLVDSTQKDTLSLAGEVQVDPARIAAEKSAAEKAKAEGDAIAAKQQQDLFGVQKPSLPPSIAEPINPPNLGLELGAGIPLPKFVDEAVAKAFEYVGDLYKEELKAPKMTDRRKAVLNWSAKLQRSFGEAAAKQREILKAVPKAIRREGITNWIQADGDAGTLALRRAETAAWRDPITGKPHPDAARLIAGYDAALKLTPEEIAVANQVKGDYANFASRGQSADVLGQLKDNYVTQTWNLSRGPRGTGTGRTLKEKFRFSKASTFANFFEGEQAGYSPKTKDISKLLPMYSHEMNSVIAARQMVAEMGNGVASDGRPLLAPKGTGIPVESKQYAVVQTPGGRAVRLYDTQAEAQAAIQPGQTIEERINPATLILPKVSKEEISDYKVLANQPALSDWKFASTDTSGNPILLKADLALHPEAYKYLKTILSRSAIREWYGTRTTALAELPKILVKGIDMANSETKRTMLGMLATFHQIQTGTHAVGHRVNPLFSIPKIDLVHDAAQMDSAKHGLMMLPDRASENQFMEGFRTSGLISKIPGIGPVADWYSNYLFTEYIPGLKYKTYDAILQRNQQVYDKQLNRGTVTLADVKVLSAEQANAAYGHINYADIGRNPTIQHIMQLGLLAPDFLEARGRFAGQAIKGLTGAKVGREQLLALATLAIAQATGAYTAAKLTDGEWDAKRPFEFVKGNRRYTLRSVPEDMQNLVTKTRQFIHSRISPIIGKGVGQYVFGTDYRGRKISAGQTTKELLAQPIPLTIRGFTGLANSTLSGMEQLAGSLGLRISRYSPMMDLHDIIVDYKKSSNDPKLKADIELQEQEVFASPYEKLRGVLHSGDLAAARKEYDKLIEIRTPKQIDAAMKPWTGGNVNRETLGLSERNPKPFTGSAKTEAAFIQSLTSDQRSTYDKAVAERLKFYQTFKKILDQPQVKDTDEFGGVLVE